MHHLTVLRLMKHDVKEADYSDRLLEIPYPKGQQMIIEWGPHCYHRKSYEPRTCTKLAPTHGYRIAAALAPKRVSSYICPIDYLRIRFACKLDRSLIRVRVS